MDETESDVTSPPPPHKKKNNGTKNPYQHSFLQHIA